MVVYLGPCEVTIKPITYDNVLTYRYSLAKTQLSIRHITQPVGVEDFGATLVDEMYVGSDVSIEGSLLLAEKTCETDPARRLAQAVLDNEEGAIFPLIDYLLETRDRKPLEDETVGVIRVSKREITEMSRWLTEMTNLNQLPTVEVGKIAVRIFGQIPGVTNHAFTTEQQTDGTEAPEEDGWG